MTPDEYFAPESNVAAVMWSKFDPILRTAATAQATRQINALVGETEVDDDAKAYAVAEQAMHILRTSGVSLDHDQNRPEFIPPDGGADAAGPNDVCGAALAWIHGMSSSGRPLRPVVTLERG